MFLLTKGLFILFTGVGIATYMACRYNENNGNSSSTNVTDNVNGNVRFSSSSGSPSSSTNCNCKKVHECNGRNRIRGQFCGFDGFVRKICCEDDPDESRRTKSILSNGSAEKDLETQAREAYLKLLASQSADSVASLITRLSTTTRSTTTSKANTKATTTTTIATTKATSTTSKKPVVSSVATTTTVTPQLNEIEALLAIPKAFVFADTTTTMSTTERPTRMTQSSDISSKLASDSQSENAIKTNGKSNSDEDILNILGLIRDTFSNQPNVNNSVPIENLLSPQYENETITGRKVGGTTGVENTVLKTDVDVTTKEDQGNKEEILSSINATTSSVSVATTTTGSSIPVEESTVEEEHNEEEPIGISVDGEVTFSPLNLDILETLSLKKGKELSIHEPSVIPLESPTTESSDISEVPAKEKESEPATTQRVTPEVTSEVTENIKAETTNSSFDRTDEMKLEITTQSQVSSVIPETIKMETTENPTTVLPEVNEIKASTEKISTELPSSVQDNINGEKTDASVDFPDENEVDATTQITVTDLNSPTTENIKIESVKDPVISSDEKEIETSTQKESLSSTVTDNDETGITKTSEEPTTPKLSEGLDSTPKYDKNPIENINSPVEPITTTEPHQDILQSEQSDSTGETFAGKHEEQNSTIPPSIPSESSSVSTTPSMKIQSTTSQPEEVTENFQIEDLVGEKSIDDIPQNKILETTTHLSSVEQISVNANILNTTEMSELPYDATTTPRSEPIAQIQESFDIIENDSIRKGNISAAESLVKAADDLESADEDENDIEKRNKKPVSQGENETKTYPIINETTSSTVASTSTDTQPNFTDIDTEGEKDVNGSTPDDTLMNSTTSESVSYPDFSDTTQTSTGASALPPVEEENELFKSTDQKNNNDTETSSSTVSPSSTSHSSDVLTNANNESANLMDDSGATTTTSEILTTSTSRVSIEAEVTEENAKSHEERSTEKNLQDFPNTDETTHQIENSDLTKLDDIENTTEINNGFSTTSSSSINNNTSDSELLDIEDELKKNLDESLLPSVTEAASDSSNNEENVTLSSAKTDLNEDIDSTNNISSDIADTTVTPSILNSSSDSDLKSTTIEPFTTEAVSINSTSMKPFFNESENISSHSNTEENESEKNDNSFDITTSLPDDLMSTEIPLTSGFIDAEMSSKSTTENSRSGEKEGGEGTTINNLDVNGSSTTNTSEETLRDDSVINIEDLVEGMNNTTENSSIANYDTTSHVSLNTSEEKQDNKMTTDETTIKSRSEDENEQESTTKALSEGKSNNDSDSVDDFPLETTPANYIDSSTMKDPQILNVTEIFNPTEIPVLTTENSNFLKETEGKLSDENTTSNFIQENESLNNPEVIDENSTATTTNAPYFPPSNNASGSQMLNITEIIPEKPVRAEEKITSSENIDDIILNELYLGINSSDKNVVMNLVKGKSSKSIDDDFIVTTTNSPLHSSNFSENEFTVHEIFEQSTEMPVTENSSDSNDISNLMREGIKDETLVSNFSPLTTMTPYSPELNITEVFGQTSEMPLSENFNRNNESLLEVSSKDNEEESDFSIVTTYAPYLDSSNISDSELNITEILEPTTATPLVRDDDVNVIGEPQSESNNEESDFSIATTNIPYYDSSNTNISDSELDITQLVGQTSEMPSSENSSDNNVVNLLGVTSKNNEEISDFSVTTTNSPHSYVSNSSDSELNVTEIVVTTSEKPLNEDSSDDKVVNLLEVSSKNNEEESDFDVPTTNVPYLHSSNPEELELNITELLVQTSEMPLNDNIENVTGVSSQNTADESDFSLVTSNAPHSSYSNLNDSASDTADIIGQTTEMPLNETSNDDKVVNLLGISSEKQDEESDVIMTTTNAPNISSSYSKDSDVNVTENHGKTSESSLEVKTIDILNLLVEEDINKSKYDVHFDDEIPTTMNPPYMQSSNVLGESDLNETETTEQTSEKSLSRNTSIENVTIMNLLSGDIVKDNTSITTTNAPYFRTTNISDSQPEEIGETTEAPNESINEINILNLLKGDSQQEDHHDAPSESVTEGVSPSVNQNDVSENEEINTNSKSETNLSTTTQSSSGKSETKNAFSSPAITDKESLETSTQISTGSPLEENADSAVELENTTVKIKEANSTSQDNLQNTSVSTNATTEKDIESRTEEATTVFQDDIHSLLNENITADFDNISHSNPTENVTEEDKSFNLETNTEDPFEGITESYKEIVTTINPKGSIDDFPSTDNSIKTENSSSAPTEIQNEQINNGTEISSINSSEMFHDGNADSGEREITTTNPQEDETKKSSDTVVDVTERMPKDEEMIMTTEREFQDEGTTQSSMNVDGDSEDTFFSTTIETPTTKRVIISSVNEIQRVSSSQSRQETRSMSSSVSILDLLSPPAKLVRPKNTTKNIVHSSKENKESFLDDMTTPSGGTVIFSDDDEKMITTENSPSDEMMETTTILTATKPASKPLTRIIKIATVNEIKRVSSSQSRYETRSQVSTAQRKPKQKLAIPEKTTTENYSENFDMTTTLPGNSAEDESGDSSAITNISADDATTNISADDATTNISADDGEMSTKLSSLERTGKNLLYKDNDKENDLDSSTTPKLSWNLADLHPYDKEPHVHYSIEGSSSTSKSVARVQVEYDTKINPITTTELPALETTSRTLEKMDSTTEQLDATTSSPNNTEESNTESDIDDEIPATTENVAPDSLEFVNADKSVETDYETTVRNGDAELETTTNVNLIKNDEVDMKTTIRNGDTELEMTTNANLIKNDEVDMKTTMNSVIFPEEYGTSTLTSDTARGTDIPPMGSISTVPKIVNNVELEKELEMNISQTVPPVMASTQSVIDHFQIEGTSTTTEKPFDLIVEDSDELNEIEVIIRRVRNEIKTLSQVKDTTTENKNSTEILETATSELTNLITFANELDKLYEIMKKEKQIARKEKTIPAASSSNEDLKEKVSNEIIMKNEIHIGSSPPNKTEIAVTEIPEIVNMTQNITTSTENSPDVNIGSTIKPDLTNSTELSQTATEVSSEKDYKTEKAFLLGFIDFLRKENTEIELREKEYNNNDVTTTEHQSEDKSDENGSTLPTSEKYIAEDTTTKIINNNPDFINDDHNNIEETSTGFKKSSNEIDSSVESENTVTGVSDTTISQDDAESPETTTTGNSQGDIILNENAIKTKKLAVGNLQWKLRPSVQLLEPSTQKEMLTTTEAPLSTTTVQPSTTMETTTTTTKIPEPEIILDINLGPPRGRALENSFDDIQESLKGNISHVVTQLLLTSHKNFHLLPNFVQCASAKYNQPKTKVLSHSVGTLDNYNYPWMARIGYREDGGVAFSCSGSVVSKRYIMTSAYCASKSPQSLMEILLENGNSDNSVKKYEVEKIIVHKEYNATTRENDIALIRVAKDFDFSEDSDVRPICLPFEDAYGIWDSLPKDGENAYIAGWGFAQNAMKNATVKIWPIENCTESYYADADKVIDSSSQICAQGSLNEDSCRGDNGASMMAIMTNREIYFQIGVVSYGPRCGYGVPSVYTKVYAYLSWILESIDS